MAEHAIAEPENGLMTLVQRVRGQMYNRKLINRCSEIPLLQRLAIQLSPHPSPRPYFVRQLEQDGNRFRFRQHGVDLVSIPALGEDKQRTAEGFALVLGEMYALPMLCWTHVRPQPGNVVLDLGGNIGTTALSMSRMVGSNGSVYVFEPISHSTLKLNMESNDIKNVTVIPMAVGATSGTVQMDTNEFACDNRVVFGEGPDDKNPGRVQVPIVSVDQWCKDTGLSNVDFIKMDIEGSEEAAIHGAKELIERSMPKWSIATEHRGPDGKPTHGKVVKLLRSMGYQTKEIGNDYVYAWANSSPGTKS